MKKIERVLVSVFDKSGVLEFIQSLVRDYDVEILSTGGTGRLLEENGIKMTQISEYTKSPEMFDGRVKTLHPKVEGGILKNKIQLIDEEGDEVAKIKAVQSEGKSVEEAKKDMEVAVSLPGVNFERQLKEKTLLYSDLGEGQFRQFKKNKDILSQEEIKTLQEIAEIKRRKKVTWGV